MRLSGCTVQRASAVGRPAKGVGGWAKDDTELPAIGVKCQSLQGEDGLRRPDEEDSANQERGSEKKSWPPRWTIGLAEQQQEGMMVLVVMCLSSMVARLQTAGKSKSRWLGGDEKWTWRWRDRMFGWPKRSALTAHHPQNCTNNFLPALNLLMDLLPLCPAFLCPVQPDALCNQHSRQPPSALNVPSDFSSYRLFSVAVRQRHLDLPHHEHLFDDISLSLGLPSTAPRHAQSSSEYPRGPSIVAW